MLNHSILALTIPLLVASCAGLDEEPTVGTPPAGLDEFAGTKSEPTGNIPTSDLDRFSSTGQLSFGTNSLTFSFHNHLAEDVKEILLRIVIKDGAGDVLSDRIYEWAFKIDAHSDSSSISLSVQRVPRDGEVFAWGIVGATNSGSSDW